MAALNSASSTAIFRIKKTLTFYDIEPLELMCAIWAGLMGLVFYIKSPYEQEWAPRVFYQAFINVPGWVYGTAFMIGSMFQLMGILDKNRIHRKIGAFVSMNSFCAYYTSLMILDPIGIYTPTCVVAILSNLLIFIRGGGGRMI